MKQLIAALTLCLLVTPAVAQESQPDAPPAEAEEGFDLMEEGARLLLRGLMSEMEPALDEMGQALDEMGPALIELAEMIGDIRNYHAPELQPNGDILIRRKTPEEMLPDAAPDPSPDSEIEL